MAAVARLPVAVLPAAQFSAAAGYSLATCASTVPTDVAARAVSVAPTSAAPTQFVLVAAAVVSLQAGELLLLLFVCPAHVHVSADPTQSVTGDYMLPADQLSLS